MGTIPSDWVEQRGTATLPTTEDADRIVVKADQPVPAGSVLVLVAGGDQMLDFCAGVSDTAGNDWYDIWATSRGTWIAPHLAAFYSPIKNPLSVDDEITVTWGAQGKGLLAQILEVTGQELVVAAGVAPRQSGQQELGWTTESDFNAQPNDHYITVVMSCAFEGELADNTPGGGAEAVGSPVNVEGIERQALGFRLHTQGEDAKGDGEISGEGTFDIKSSYVAGAIGVGERVVIPFANDDPQPSSIPSFKEVGQQSVDGPTDSYEFTFTEDTAPGELVVLVGRATGWEPWGLMEIADPDHNWDVPVHTQNADMYVAAGGIAFCRPTGGIKSGHKLTISYPDGDHTGHIAAAYEVTPRFTSFDDDRLKVIGRPWYGPTNDWGGQAVFFDYPGFCLSVTHNRVETGHPAHRGDVSDDLHPGAQTVGYYRAMEGQDLMQVLVTEVDDVLGNWSAGGTYEDGGEQASQAYTARIEEAPVVVEDPAPDPPVWLIDAGSDVQSGSGVTGVVITINQDIPIGSFLTLSWACGYGTADDSVEILDPTGNSWSLGEANLSPENEPWCGQVFSQNSTKEWKAGDKITLNFTGADMKTNVCAQLALIKGGPDWVPNAYEGRAPAKRGDRDFPTTGWDTEPHDMTKEVGGIVSLVALNGEALSDPPPSEPAQGGVVSFLRAGSAGMLNPPYQTLLQVQGSQVVKGPGTQVTGTFIGALGIGWCSMAEYFEAKEIPPPPPPKEGHPENIGNPKRKRLKQPNVPTIGH